jgi:hypothetical protein
VVSSLSSQASRYGLGGGRHGVAAEIAAAQAEAEDSAPAADAAVEILLMSDGE